MPESDGKLVYPPGVRDITEEISTDDLVRRLKDCSHVFQNMNQDDDNTTYIPLALHLASETYLEHNSREIQLLVACCIADVFRVYAPEAPYKDLGQLKIIFEFFVQQLKGLEDPQNPYYKRYFYLLENLSCVKTFNICLELEENQKIICSLFKVMFSIINDSHSVKVKKIMLEIMTPLITEADVVSQELLDVILNQIIEPTKSRNKNAGALAQDILKRTTKTIEFEPYIQNFFNNTLMRGKKSQREMSRCLYELIYELNEICPGMLVVGLPQLEFKLKSNEEIERLEVTKVLARMFSDPNSLLAQQNRSLWTCFLGRFRDISIHVRTLCVQYSIQFLLNHPELREDITEQLKQRQHDLEESVRLEVVSAIISTARKDFSSINEDLLSFVKAMTLDKKFKIRKEALLGLATLYKQHLGSADLSTSAMESISWIKNKALHVYYQTDLEDKLLVERILHTCLVPYQSPMEIRMKNLYQLFASIDDYAVKAFKDILNCRHSVRKQVKDILVFIQRSKSKNKMKTVTIKVAQLTKSQDPVHSQDYILKFCKEVKSNLKLRNMLSVLLNENITCSEAEMKVKEILKTLGLPVQTNTYYMIIKQLLERIAPVLVDKEGIRYLISFVTDSLVGDGTLEAEMNLCDSSSRGLELLHVLSYVFPSTFHDEEIYNNLLKFLKSDVDSAAEVTLEILRLVTENLERKFPEVFLNLVPLLENFVETGTVKQAKHAVYCLSVIANDKEVVFGNIIENLKKHFTLESQYFRTALVSVGHIAYLCHDMFATQFKNIVAKVVVKDLLMLDQDIPRGGDETWGPVDALPDETKAKIEGMKLMVRWLLGLKDMVTPAVSTLRLLTTVILHGGDLMERQHTAPIENSWMRYTAASCMLKLCQEPNYASSITLEQFQVLALMISDRCYEVREKIFQKLHKALIMLKLPLEFLAIFVLGGIEEKKELKQQIKNHFVSNINKRREYIKLHPMPSTKLVLYLPDYVLPYAIHLLAHAPFFEAYDDVPSLLKVKECLWLIMEPLILKNENYSFSFFKRLLENIKQTKDKQAVADEITNFKLYAVCDLALGLMMSKTTNFVLKDFPTEPLLPAKFFTSVDKSYSNMKTYLPAELISTLPQLQKTGFEIEMFDSTDKGPDKKEKKIAPSKSSKLISDNLTPSASEPSVSEIPSEVNEISSISTPSSLPEETTNTANAQKIRTRGRRKLTQESLSPTRDDSSSQTLTNSPMSLPSKPPEKDSEVSNSEIEPTNDTVSDSSSETSPQGKRPAKAKKGSSMPAMSYARTRSTRNNSVVSPSNTVNSQSSSHNSAITGSPRNTSVTKLKADANANSSTDTNTNSRTGTSTKSRTVTSVRTSRSGTRSESSTKSVQNGLSSPTDSELVLTSNVRHLIKNCNVSLDKDEIEKYSSSSIADCSESVSDKESTLSNTDVLKSSKGLKKSKPGSDSRKRPPSPSPSPVAAKSANKISRISAKKDGPVSSPVNKRKRDISSEKKVKKAKTNSPDNSSKESDTLHKTSKQTINTLRKNSKQTSQKLSKQATSVTNQKVTKQTTLVNKSPLSSSLKSSKSKTPVSPSNVKNVRTTLKKLAKSPLVNGTRSGDNAKTVVNKASKNKPKAAKQPPILKKGRKIEGKQASKRR